MAHVDAQTAVRQAVADRDAAKAAYDAALARLHVVIREAGETTRQVDLVKLTGYTRERIRQITGRRPAARGD